MGSGAEEPTDDDFNLVTGLYHFDGTNGGTNATFLDSSSNSLTIGLNGNTTQGSLNPFNSGRWSNEFKEVSFQKQYLYIENQSTLTPELAILRLNVGFTLVVPLPIKEFFNLIQPL